MPVMFAVGKQKVFRSREEGLKAGFYDSYNDLAAACRAETFGTPDVKPEPVEAPEPVIEPPAEEQMDIEKVTEAPPAAAQRPLPDLTSAEVKELAEQYDIPTEGVHHMTLRKQVEEHLNQQGGVA